MSFSLCKSTFSCAKTLRQIIKTTTTTTPLSRSIITTSLMQHNDDHKKKMDKKTPKGRLDDEYDESPKSYQEKEPLEPHPNNTNPNTGEINGPKGPEPTRYGDWERKGRCIDF